MPSEQDVADSSPVEKQKLNDRQLQFKKTIATAVVLLAAAFFIGMAQIALLPPWEGFDETAHFSYIQQVAETYTWPHLGDPLSLEVESYANVAPMPYSPTPPYDDNGHWTYHRLFGASDQIIEKARRLTHAMHENTSRWHPGNSPNWESQHPPLYYVFLAPIYSISKTWSLIDQLFLLRGISYVFSWTALGMVTFAEWRWGQRSRDTHEMQVLSPALWPYLFPMWFPEMARLGNDGLVALVAALAWLSLCHLVRAEGGRRDYTLLGLICGMGLLTKATFFPLTGCVSAFLVIRLWQGRHDKPLQRQRAEGLGLFSVALLITAGWWFLQKVFETGNVLGAGDVTNARLAGGILNGVMTNGSIAIFWHGLFNMFATFLWIGTWSLVQPPLKAIAPLGVMTLLVAGGHLWWLRKNSQALNWVPLATLGVFVAGLCYDLSAFIAVYGSGGTPGWYLHSFAPVFAPILATGLVTLLKRREFRIPLLAFFAYPLLFIPAMGFLEMLIYSGCGKKMSILNNYDYHEASVCADHISLIIRNLSILGSPRLAIYLFTVGYIFLLIGVFQLMRAYWTKWDPIATS